MRKSSILKMINLNNGQSYELTQLNMRILHSFLLPSDDSSIFELAGGYELNVGDICNPICDQIYSDINNEEVNIEEIKKNFDCTSVCNNVCMPICSNVCDRIW